MKTGTKSLLFGVHQFLIHPIVVWIAWYKLYGFPDWRECFCIFIHDWGYFGKKNMDDEEGEKHPELAAKIAGFLFGDKYRNLCLYHSRHYARKFGADPSSLCWADKLSITYEKWWIYLPRALLSGELKEYRVCADRGGLVPASYTHREWFHAMCEKFRKLANSKDVRSIPYTNEKRKEQFSKEK